MKPLKMLLALSLLLIQLTTDSVAKESEYTLIEWPELMPEEDFKALMNPPDYISEIAEGSKEDQVTKTKQTTTVKNDPYQQALVSTRTRPDFNNRKVKVPGFIVPLEFDNNMVITEFFLVPYFGACIHVPPPPPNQIIYIRYAKGLQLDNLYDPLYVEGTLHIDNFDAQDMGSSAYRLDVHNIIPYKN